MCTCVYMCVVCVYMCVACVQVREQLVGVGFLLPPNGLQRFNSGCESWLLVPLLSEPFYWPEKQTQF